jgi:hypothetical protein
LATARKPAPDELKVLSEIYKQQLAAFQKDQAAVEKLMKVGAFQHDPKLDKSEVAAWSTIASMLLNLDETLTKG